MRLFIVIVDLSLLVITRTRLPALHSRCTVIDFAIKNGQKVKTAKALLDRLSKVLTDEDVDFDKKVLAELIQKYYPDFRRTINELQRYSVRR